VSQKVPQSADDLQAHLADHIQFLIDSSDAFDAGREGEAKRIAVSLRVLLHDSGTSHSLLQQLNRLGAEFLSTALPHEQGSLSTHGGLVMIAMDGKATRFVAMLDEVPFKQWLPFDQWWNEPVFVDDRQEILTRRDLILSVANQDGGAHVDPALNEKYARLSRHNSLGWTHSDGTATSPIPKAEKAAIRQIGHEILRTLLPDYSRQQKHKAEMFVGGGMMFSSATVPPMPTVPEVGRNDPCPCGTGKKYKKCHGARAV
jgi:hypothetical protein